VASQPTEAADTIVLVGRTIALDMPNLATRMAAQLYHRCPPIWMGENALRLCAVLAELAHALGSILFKLSTGRVQVEAAAALALAPEAADQALGIVLNVASSVVLVCAIQFFARPAKVTWLSTCALNLGHLEP